MSGPIVVVHSGFHKTGTTSIQHFLSENGEYIWPRAALVLPWKIRSGAGYSAVRYSNTGLPEELALFRRHCRTVLEKLNLGKRNLIISEENLCGRMPGRYGHEGYEATPILMREMERMIHKTLGEDAVVKFIFTTRDADAWLHSVWLHNLRKTRLTLSYEEFSDLHKPSADFQHWIEAIKVKVNTPHVSSVPLEAFMTAPEGPAKLILDAAEHPVRLRQKMSPMVIKNKAPGNAVSEALLSLNRSSVDGNDYELALSNLLNDAD